jgi:hypothetical protein
MGQAVSEIRTAEINGDPSSIEIIVGGKDGGLWALDANGKELWSHTVADKVTEIVGVDFDDDGRQEVVIGDDAGEVIIFSPDGNRSSVKGLLHGHHAHRRGAARQRARVGRLGHDPARSPEGGAQRDTRLPVRADPRRLDRVRGHHRGRVDFGDDAEEA